MKFFTTSKLSENISETPEGYLVCFGVAVARGGEMIYGPGETPLDPGPDGRVIITRETDDIFRPETMASFEGKAVTIMHPAEFVSPENWSQLAKGVIQNVRKGEGEQEGDLVADLLITDSAAISLVKGGLREVSCGYEAEYTQTGVGQGFQKNIIGNHIALVREGRAGSAYAINDHKGKGSKMKLQDRIKSIFSKAQDEALKAATEDENTETPQEVKGFVSADDFGKSMKEVHDKLDLMMGKKKEEGSEDASTQPTESQPAHVVAKDDDQVENSMEARLAKLEASVAALLEKMSPSQDEAGGDDEVTDEEGEMEESEDEDGDMDEADDAACYGKTGDAAAQSDLASRVEILAPGMKVEGKDIKVKALTAFYATKDGKAVIEQFTLGGKPDFKQAVLVDSLFVGASELLKIKRNADLAASKTFDFKSNLGQPKGAMTPEEMNKKNSEYYGSK